MPARVDRCRPRWSAGARGWPPRSAWPVRCLVKRDDLTGFALAGNKARQLEYLLGDALATRRDVLVTGGRPGLELLPGRGRGRRVAPGSPASWCSPGDEPPAAPPEPGARPACRGASVRFTGDPDRASWTTRSPTAPTSCAPPAAGRTSIPRGGATPLGAVGYALARRRAGRAARGAGHRSRGGAGGDRLRAGPRPVWWPGPWPRGRRWRVVGAIREPAPGRVP